MSTKNQEVEEAKERATRLIAEANRNAQESMDKSAQEEQKKTQAFLKSMPPTPSQKTQTASSSAAPSGAVHE